MSPTLDLSLTRLSLLTNSCLGNFVGPLVFKQEDAPRYGPGFIIVVITCGISILLTVIHRYYCIWDNNKRDKAGIPEGFDHAFEDDSTDLKVRISPPHLFIRLMLTC